MAALHLSFASRCPMPLRATKNGTDLMEMGWLFETTISVSIAISFTNPIPIVTFCSREQSRMQFAVNEFSICHSKTKQTLSSKINVPEYFIHTWNIIYYELIGTGQVAGCLQTSSEIGFWIQKAITALVDRFHGKGRDSQQRNLTQTRNSFKAFSNVSFCAFDGANSVCTPRHCSTKLRHYLQSLQMTTKPFTRNYSCMRNSSSSTVLK